MERSKSTPTTGSPVDISLRVLLLESLSLVVELPSLGDADFHLGHAVLEIEMPEVVDDGGQPQRDGIEEEFRLSSRDPTDRLQWVAGVFVDRCDRRKLYITTQVLAGSEALLQSPSFRLAPG